MLMLLQGTHQALGLGGGNGYDAIRRVLVYDPRNQTAD